MNSLCQTDGSSTTLCADKMFAMCNGIHWKSSPSIWMLRRQREDWINIEVCGKCTTKINRPLKIIMSALLVVKPTDEGSGHYCGWCGTNERIENDQNSFLPIAFSAVNEMQFDWNQFHFIANRTELIPGKCQFPSRRASIPIRCHSQHASSAVPCAHPSHHFAILNIHNASVVFTCAFSSRQFQCYYFCVPFHWCAHCFDFDAIINMFQSFRHLPHVDTGSVVWTNSCLFSIR